MVVNLSCSENHFHFSEKINRVGLLDDENTWTSLVDRSQQCPETGPGAAAIYGGASILFFACLNNHSTTSTKLRSGDQAVLLLQRFEDFHETINCSSRLTGLSTIKKGSVLSCFSLFFDLILYRCYFKMMLPVSSEGFWIE